MNEARMKKEFSIKCALRATVVFLLFVFVQGSLFAQSFEFVEDASGSISEIIFFKSNGDQIPSLSVSSNVSAIRDADSRIKSFKESLKLKAKILKHLKKHQFSEPGVGSGLSVINTVALPLYGLAGLLVFEGSMSAAIVSTIVLYTAGEAAIRSLFYSRETSLNNARKMTNFTCKRLMTDLSKSK